MGAVDCRAIVDLQPAREYRLAIGKGDNGMAKVRFGMQSRRWTAARANAAARHGLVSG
jgi:hypothetical protein